MTILSVSDVLAASLSVFISDAAVKMDQMRVSYRLKTLI